MKNNEANITRINKYGVRVGDIFCSSWGYDQTNVDFFQVVALVGESSVRVREVNPPIIEEEATGPMAAHYTYALTHEILPAADYSLFVRDQEHGDVKRLKNNGCPAFKISSYADAMLCKGESKRCYVSWYA